MVVRGQGHLVYVSSAATFSGAAMACSYSAAKAGTALFSEAIGQEILFRRWNGIRVSIVYPSAVASGLCDMSLYDGIVPLMEPDYVANEIIQGVLIEREAIYVPHSLYGFRFMRLFMNAKAFWHLSVATVLGEDPFKTLLYVKPNNQLAKGRSN